MLPATNYTVVHCPLETLFACQVTELNLCVDVCLGLTTAEAEEGAGLVTMAVAVGRPHRGCTPRKGRSVGLPPSASAPCLGNVSVDVDVDQAQRPTMHMAAGKICITWCW